MPIKGTNPKNVKKLIRTNSPYIEYTFLDQIFKKSGKKWIFYENFGFVLIMKNKLKNCQQRKRIQLYVTGFLI